MSILKSHSERIIFINIRVATQAGGEKPNAANCVYVSESVCLSVFVFVLARISFCVSEACLLPTAAAAAAENRLGFW